MNVEGDSENNSDNDKSWPVDKDVMRDSKSSRSMNRSSNKESFGGSTNLAVLSLLNFFGQQ